MTDGCDLWDRTQEAGRGVVAAFDRVLGAPSDRTRVAAAPELLRAVRAFLTLRLVAVTGDRRRAFPLSVPPAGRETVAALWAEVFWAARTQAEDDDSGVLEATDASIRGLLALEPADLARRESVRAWRERLAAVEETFAGLEVQAQAALDVRREAF
ncbi:hypothetical protein [Petropleomorpha daqingensis]|uniref:Uncharacterized protein n=1 Tax=Petropleomorpha daqingensis TaxID=2026353 RepID=A0A853CP37_9ACTN|nr:hypothetical protein [Petropleomorpha daqingensis]NYJ08272.1 hypothetical protein [Petropleomorpha daqingensis]